MRGDVLSEPTRTVPNMLTDGDLALLDFEQQWWRYPGAKEAAIREQFGLSATRYYQRLNTIIGTPAALAARPLSVRRLTRLRASRRRTLAAR